MQTDITGPLILLCNDHYNGYIKWTYYCFAFIFHSLRHFYC